MGNLLSSTPTIEGDADHVKSESETMDNTNVFNEDTANTSSEDTNEDEARAKAKEEEMTEFKRQLTFKREQRREILARHRTEKEELERSLQREKAVKLELLQNNKLLCELLTRNGINIPENLEASEQNSELSDTLIQMREDFIKIKSNNTQLRKDLAETNSALQLAYSDISDLRAENIESIKQIRALKEVVAVSKTMITLREQQLNELKSKLNEIEHTLADRETNLLSADLRQEYERQLQNIRTLRGLYEERARLAEVTRLGLVRELDEHKALYEVEVKKSRDLAEKVEELETRTDTLIDTIDNKNSQISSYQEETNNLKAEMAVVNKLFSQVLLGYKTKQDLDTLVHRLEENHGILTQMAERENGSEMSSALPKLLLELVSQIDEKEEHSDDDEITKQEIMTLQPTDPQKSLTTAEDIVANLPKVWKVLIELLSHQNTPDVDSSEKVTTCYKSVETASGSVLVPSVSQTYIRLKDLIIEKLGLIKEVNRMKQLNSHLETRLEEQERRLCLVTTELSKTWHVVGRLRKHHQQLHTHEKILKYELQQKRKLLNELKEELEYCREKWEQAREKNTQSERDWRKLRAEFSSRNAKAPSPSFNNSGESGYSDERPSDDSSESNDESEYVAEPLKRCKKKVKKSFEIILDSSGDFNLAAEREDPASDMQDVADLPLDTQENEENHGVSSEPSKSELFPSTKKICEETEDEIADIAHDDSYPEEVQSQSNRNANTANISQQHDVILPTVSPQLPTSSVPPNDSINIEESITNKEEIATEIGEQLLKSENTSINTKLSNGEKVDNVSQIVSASKSLDLKENIQGSKDLKQPKVVANLKPSSEISTPDFKAILENIRKQDQRLAQKDQRLQNLEDSCSEVVKNISNTLTSGDKMIEKLESLHNEHKNVNNNCDKMENSSLKEDKSNSEREETQPSTSNEIDHEARFAARDLRLKRLEEQTKSLVNKVNNTTSKGVKIHYKLEELHNIYGSESSRAGTPSEESEGKTDMNDSTEE